MFNAETPKSIQTIVDDPDNSPFMAQLLDKFVAAEGEKKAEKAAGDFGLYIAYVASGRSATNMLRER
jgi:hypothetical protein